MSLPFRDRIASGFVAVAVIVYLLWLLLADRTTAGTRTIAVVVLALGFAASATAVVPGFDELLHASRVYLVVTTLIGLAAAVVGVLAIVQADAVMLAVLVVATALMWSLATVRHLWATSHAGTSSRPPTDRPRAAHA